jgi:lysophospholipase L1-like esterase
MAVGVWANTAVDSKGVPVASRAVTVFTDQAGTVLAPVFTDASGSVPVAGSVVVSDGQGNLEVFAAPGSYWGRVVGQSFTFPIVVGEVAGQDSVEASARVAGDSAEATARTAAIGAQHTTDNATYHPLDYPGSLASGVTLGNLYQGARFAYNMRASNTRKLRKSLGVALDNSALTEWTVIGDSEAAGHGIGTVHSWPLLLANLAAQSGAAIGGTTGMAASDADDVGGGTGARWTISGMSVGTFFLVWNASAQTATFVSERAGTALDLFYFNNSGTFTYAIDGAAAVTVTPTGASSIGKTTVTGLTNATHTVVISSTSASGYFIGAKIRQPTGLLISNFGASGTKTSDWINSSFSGEQSMSTVINPTPDVVLIALGGTNDSPGGVVSVSAYQANLASLVTTYQGLASAPNVILVSEICPNTVTTAAFQPYTAAMYAVADSANIPLIDISDMFGTNAQATAAGLLQGDNLHYNSAGHGAHARAVFANTL